MHGKLILQKLAFIVLIALPGQAFPAPASSDSETKTVAIVFLKHVPPYCPNPADCEPSWPPEKQALILPPRYTAGQYQAILNYLVSNYYYKNSLNNVDLEFTAVINPNSNDGWFDAPHKIFEYNLGIADLRHDGATMAYNAIGSAVDDYDYLVTVHNYRGRSGQACKMEGPPYFGPADCTFSVGSGSVSLGALYVSENANNPLLAALLSHELGHLLGVPDQYSSGGMDAWPGMGPWDLMSDDRPFNHFGAWSKWNRGWIPTVTDMPCMNGPCEVTTVLDPLEYPGNNVLRIPFVADPFEGYMVECRHPVNNDENIPEAGVLVTSIDPWRPIGSSVAQVASSVIGDDFPTAALAPGEAFFDEDRDITITYFSKDGVNRCTVKAERGEIDVPDPEITRGSEEPSSAGYNKYKSRDIWIDSPENGWDEYPQGESYMQVDDQSVPTGYGDPFWEDHENRIKFLVENRGYGAAENVMVDIYVTQPLLIYIPGGTCDGPEPNSADLLASIVIDHLEAGESYFGSVAWTPTSPDAAQVKVVIRDYLGEITHSNNTASETYAHQYTMVDILDEIDVESILETAGSVFGSVTIDTDETCPYQYPYRFERKLINAIEKRHWVMTFDDTLVMETPYEATEIQLASLPPEDAQAGDCEEITLELVTLVGDVYMPADGLTFESCVVERTELTCSTPVETAKAGNPVDVSGKLSASRGGEKIAVEYTSPKGESRIQNVTVGDDGSYQDQFVPKEEGKWQVKAFWQGSDRSAPAESGLCSFTVGNMVPEFTLSMNANCRSGPGTAYPIVTSGLAGEVVAIDARNGDATWLHGTLYGARCWVWLGAGELNVNPWTLRERQAPALPSLPDEIH